MARNLIDIFSGDAFGVVSLTASVNNMPFKPGLLGSLGIFTEEGVDSVSVAIEEYEGDLALIPATERGAAPARATNNKAKVRTLRSVHLAEEKTILADQIIGRRVFGGADGADVELETAQAVVAKHQTEMVGKLDFTLENQRLGAVKGIVTDADGSTLYDLFSEFGVSAPAAATLELDQVAPGIRKRLAGLRRTMGKNLGSMGGDGAFMVGCLAGDDLFDALINHDEVKTAYERWESGQALREDYTWRDFVYAGVRFINYRGADDASFGVASSEGHMFPMVPGLFRTYFSPGDFLDAAGTSGLPRYSATAVDPEFGRWAKVHVQSNPLNVCLKPKTLQKVTLT